MRLKEDECGLSMRKLVAFFEEARLLRGVKVSEACRHELNAIVHDDVDLSFAIGRRRIRCYG